MISVSIVVFNTRIYDLNNLINSFLKVSLKFTLYIVDNSATNKLEDYFKKFEFVRYIHNPSNPGFGAAHNIAIKKAMVARAKYHFVVNPDVSFPTSVIEKMVAYLDSNDRVGMMMPQVLNEDNSIQHLPKLLPTPWSIPKRILNKRYGWFAQFANDYELRDVPSDKIYSAPIISGCFTLFRLEALKKIGIYDDKFFMYFEDWDLSRRMHVYYDTIYFPEVSIYHGYESGANKSGKLFRIFLKSAVCYFNKWGWFFDRKRSLINKETLNQFR